MNIRIGGAACRPIAAAVVASGDAAAAAGNTAAAAAVTSDSGPDSGRSEARLEGERIDVGGNVERRRTMFTLDTWE